jgi:hypothetical protein
MTLHQSQDLICDMSSQLSRDGSSDDLLYDVSGNHSHALGSSGSFEDQVKAEDASEHKGRLTRRRSLMSQASVKRLFKWKTR